MLMSKDGKVLVSYPSASGEIELRDGIEVIGWAAFGYCPITKLTLPASINRIEGWAFDWCTQLTTLIMYSPTPPVLYASAFPGEIGDDEPYSTYNIFVPNEYLEAYKSKGWEKSIQDLHIYGLDQLAEINKVGTKCPSAYTVYTLSGLCILENGDLDALNRLPSGLYIVNGKKIYLNR